MRIDLGGFAKGHAVDNAVAILRRRGIAHAMVSAGGDSRVIGTGAAGLVDRRARPAHQTGAGDAAARGRLDLDFRRLRTLLRSRRRALSSLDRPATGESPSGIQSVMILATMA
jgi:thiamine biosynthesis lipoprotein